MSVEDHLLAANPADAFDFRPAQADDYSAAFRVRKRDESLGQLFGLNRGGLPVEPLIFRTSSSRDPRSSGVEASAEPTWLDGMLATLNLFK
ncbi:hypothetical protein ACQPZJ_06205 [Actinoplanes sp. CA-054009]